MEIVSSRQRNEFLALLSKHPELTSFCHPYERSKIWSVWTKLAKKLNSLGTCKKTPKKWRHYLADVKCKARRRKARKESLTDFERQVLDLTNEDVSKAVKNDHQEKQPIPNEEPSVENEQIINSDLRKSEAQSEMQETTSSNTSASNKELVEALARLERKREEAEAETGAASSRLLGVMQRQLAVQEQQISCLQRIVERLLQPNPTEDNQTVFQ